MFLLYLSILISFFNKYIISECVYIVFAFTTEDGFQQKMSPALI